MGDILLLLITLTGCALACGAGYYLLIVKPVNSNRVTRRLIALETETDYLQQLTTQIDDRVKKQCDHITLLETLIEEDRTTFKQLNELLREGNLDMIKKLVDKSIDPTRYSDLHESSVRLELCKVIYITT